MPTFPLESIGVGSQLYLTAAPGIEIGTRLNGGHFRDTVEQGVVTDHGSILEIAWELVRMREFRRDHADSTRSFFGQMRLQHEDGITAKAFSTPKQAHSADCTKLRWNGFVKSGPPT